MDEDSGPVEDVADALDAYGCDGTVFRTGPPTYGIGEDTGWQELEAMLYERAADVREAVGTDWTADEEYAMEQLFGRASLEEYDCLLDDDHEHVVSVLDDQDDIRAVHDAVDSCIAGDDARAREFAEDPYTLVASIERGGDQLGYLRAFLLEDGAGRPFLGVDALEVPDHQHERYSNVIRAGGLALCHLAAEIGIGRAIARDDRAGYGLRQAFSSTAEDVAFEKPGTDVFSHGFHPATDGMPGYRLWEDPGRIIADRDGEDRS